jgi:hypothetical protein
MIMWFLEWRLELGEPTGPCRREKEVYTREYENGLIVLNGGMSARTVQLNTPYVTVDTERIGSVELQSYTGAIILKPQDTQAQ